MLMSWIFTVMAVIAVIFAMISGHGSELAAAIPKGAQAGIELVLSMGGALCLWTGLGRLMEKCGITAFLARLLRPILHRLFPDSKKDPALSRVLSANICANILGLGNAATPMGLQAAEKLSAGKAATDQLCRLIVLNTASIQLIPSTVAALRASLGCKTPFDILPAVWVTSICAALVGVGLTLILGRVWKK